MIQEGHTRLGVMCDGGGEADTGGAAASGGDGQRRQVHDRAQQLALGHARVAHQQAVYVPTQVRAVGQVALPRRSRATTPFSHTFSSHLGLIRCLALIQDPQVYTS